METEVLREEVCSGTTRVLFEFEERSEGELFMWGRRGGREGFNVGLVGKEPNKFEGKRRKN